LQGFARSFTGLFALRLATGAFEAPSYPINKSGYLASVPFLAATAGLLLSGFVSDYQVKRGKSVGRARKLPIIIGLLLSVSIVGANYTDETALIIFFMSLSFFGPAWP
jgi:MFS family permease